MRLSFLIGCFLVAQVLGYSARKSLLSTLFLLSFSFVVHFLWMPWVFHRFPPSYFAEVMTCDDRTAGRKADQHSNDAIAPPPGMTLTATGSAPGFYNLLETITIKVSGGGTQFRGILGYPSSNIGKVVAGTTTVVGGNKGNSGIVKECWSHK